MVTRWQDNHNKLPSKRGRMGGNIATAGSLQFWNPSTHMSHFLDLSLVPLPDNDFPWFLTLGFWFHLLNHSFISINHSLSLQLNSFLSLLPAHRSLGTTFYFILFMSSLAQASGASINTILLKTVVMVFLLTLLGFTPLDKSYNHKPLWDWPFPIWFPYEASVGQHSLDL